jgi:hypothetical protein
VTEATKISAEVLEAELDLTAGTDPAAVGATVSDELCGSWDHEGPCRWPHRNEIDAASGPARFRTVAIAPTAEMAEVLRRIEDALRRDPRWSVHSTVTRPPAPDEADLVDRLAAAPRLAA